MLAWFAIMPKSVLTIITLAFALLIASPRNVAAQQPQNRCSQIRYAVPSSNTRPYRLNHIEGQAVYASPEQKWELGPAGGVCVVIFDNASKSQVAIASTDDKGQFYFGEVRPGAYTLVASAGELQIISVAVRFNSGIKLGSKRLLLHLREKRDARISYVTLVTNADLRREMLVMVEQDQNIRDEMIKSGAAHPSEDIRSRMGLIDRRNTLRMRSIIKKYGWPGSGLVGWDGSNAAFVIVQHSDHKTQKDLLPLIKKEFRTGNLSGPNYALFVDRVRVKDGRPQIYGSQAKLIEEWKEGEPVLYPIEDERNVDRRRAEVGLSPLAEYRKTLKNMYKPD